jgi:hypothetical protein
VRRPLLALSVAAASIALAAGLTAPAAQAATTIPTGRFALGDSVMLGAKPNLISRGFVVDATESRQFSAAPAIIATKARLGVLKRNVIIALGTNGTVRLSDCLAIVSAAGPNRRVFLVNNRVPRSWQAGNNTTLAQCANSTAFAASRVYLIDWYSYSRNKSSWFYSDGFHLRPTGKSAYATLLDAKLDALGR